MKKSKQDTLSQYKKLLTELRNMIKNGKDESEEGDLLRQKMDDLWPQIPEKARREINKIVKLLNLKVKRDKQSVLEDIKNHPENHIHDFDGVSACSVLDNIIDLEILDAHSKYIDFGSNGGVRCDVLLGPCACGAWHQKDEPRIKDILKRYPTMLI